MSRGRRWARRGTITAIVTVALFFGVVPGAVDRALNAVEPDGIEPSPEALALHETLRVADLHADTLLWGRGDLLTRRDHGLVDVPRLVEGGVAVQAFFLVTKVPWGLNIHENSDDTDMTFWLGLSQRWPVRTWGSLLHRALFFSDRLHAAAARSQGSLVVVRSRSDLRQALERRTLRPRTVAAVIGVEGAQALDGSVDNLPILFDAGVRIMAPSHSTTPRWEGPPPASPSTG